MVVVYCTLEIGFCKEHGIEPIYSTLVSRNIVGVISTSDSVGLIMPLAPAMPYHINPGITWDYLETSDNGYSRTTSD